MIYHGVCTIRWMTWMTDWITRITILHHSIPLNACNKPKTYSLYLPFLCRIFMREKVWYEFDAELNHLWDYNWILIFHKAADKCLPCPFYLLPDRRIKRPFIKIWLIWVHLTYKAPSSETSRLLIVSDPDNWQFYTIFSYGSSQPRIGHEVSLPPFPSRSINDYGKVSMACYPNFIHNHTWDLYLYL